MANTAKNKTLGTCLPIDTARKVEKAAKASGKNTSAFIAAALVAAMGETA